MKIMMYISAMAVCMALPSCMDMSSVVEEESIRFIQGKVCDENGTPIEHIMVNVDWDKLPGDIVYTSSDGEFKVVIPEVIINTETTIDLTLSDIDGTENGGLFETLKDKIMLLPEEDDLSEIILDYHLTHATLSENTPQS